MASKSPSYPRSYPCRIKGRRGLLLPQVASERGWDVETFLRQTCLKAGLAQDEWQRGAEIQVFTVHHFTDGLPLGPVEPLS